MRNMVRVDGAGQSRVKGREAKATAARRDLSRSEFWQRTGAIYEQASVKGWREVYGIFQPSIRHHPEAAGPGEPRP